MVARGGGHFCGVSHTLAQMGGANAYPKLFWDFLHTHTHTWYEKQQPNSAPKLVKLDERKIFTSSTTPLALSKIFMTKLLMCDLFVIANLVSK